MSSSSSAGRSLASIARLRVRRPPRRARSPRPCAGASPDRISSSTPCSRRKATVSRASSRSRSASTTRPSVRATAGGPSSACGCARPGGALATATTRRPAAVSARWASASAPRPKRSGAPSSRLSPSSSTALQRRREVKATSATGWIAAAGNACASACIVRFASPVAAARRDTASRQLGLADARGRDEPLDAQRRLRERPGLVQAHHVDRRERLDAAELLHERTAPRHPDRGDRRRQAREQHQPFGDEDHERRDGGRHRLLRRCRPHARRSAIPRTMPSGTIARTRTVSSSLSPRSIGERGWRNARATSAIRSA